MTPRSNEERQFSEDVERLLRGEEPAESAADADYVETLRFARRLIELREEPAAAFADRLRHRLVTSMAEQDAVAPTSETWFVRLFARRGLSLALASTFVVLAAVGLVWRAGLLSPAMPQSGEPSLPGMLTVPSVPDAAAPQAPLARGPEDTAKSAAGMPPDALNVNTSIAVTVATAPAIPSGESVNISITFSNHGPDGYELSPFPPAVVIRETATGRVVYTFTGGTGNYPLSALETARYDIAWDQKDDSGAPASPGLYEVNVEMMEARLEKGDLTEWMGAYNATAFNILAPTMENQAAETDTGR